VGSPQCIWLAGAGSALGMLERILQGGGFTVVLKDTEALSNPAPDGKPDLVILADEPPALTQLMARVKSHPFYRDIPVIAALTRFSDAAAAQTLGLGAEEFLTPPFQAPEVLARVAVVLRLNQERRLLQASQAEFSRLFADSPAPLFYCDRDGFHCRLNPALLRLLGYGGRHREPPPQDLNALFFSAADRERFLRVLHQEPQAGPVKIRLRNREGDPVTVLLADMSHPGASPAQVGFSIRPVGSVSPLKKALHHLVETFLPAARDHLALLEMTPLLGGRYEKIKKLGQGSYGEVWLVRDTEVLEGPRDYVAKIPLSRTVNAKLRKEAVICRRLSPHPGVVRLVDLLEEDDKVILIQEYVAGRTLEEMLEHELPRPLVESLVLQLIDVVAHAHQHRIMHRDIKPGNIIVTPEGTLKLLDFGAAKILKEKDVSATMVGSRPFMAPEQIMGRSERRSDIWAVGVVMYLLYTGELPFYHEVEKVLIDLILETEPTPPRELNPEIPEAMEAIIMKCLEKEVERRYPHARALKAALLKHFPGYGQRAA
jgi:PAS domain-containing protein